MKSTIKLTLVAAVLAASIGFVNSAVGAGPAYGTKNVTLACTSTQTFNFALIIEVQDKGSAYSVRVLTNAHGNYDTASVYAGQPFYSDYLSMSKALSKSGTNGLAPINEVFATEAGQCRAHGDPIVLFTL